MPVRGLAAVFVDRFSGRERLMLGCVFSSVLGIAGCDVGQTNRQEDPAVTLLPPSSPPLSPPLSEALLAAQLADPEWQAALVAYVGKLEPKPDGPEIDLQGHVAVDQRDQVDVVGFSRFCALPDEQKSFYRGLAVVRMPADDYRRLVDRFWQECGARLLTVSEAAGSRWVVVYGAGRTVSEKLRLDRDGVRLSIYLTE